MVKRFEKPLTPQDGIKVKIELYLRENLSNWKML
jgi:hypothetical protein